MVKKLCVSQRLFGKCLGYGLWSLATIGVLFALFASSYEVSTINEHVKDQPYGLDLEFCYTNVSDGFKERCYSWGGWVTSNGPSERYMISILLIIIDMIGIGSWVYYKQQKFKFAWCENIKQGMD